MTIPLPQETLEAGDSVAVLTDPETLADVRIALRGDA
jgi:Trk K+ transport system NAD-binding subunit